MKDISKKLQFYGVILRSIADGVFTVDSNRVITSFNPAAEKITGIPASMAIGNKCYDVFHSDVCERCVLEKTFKTGIETVDRPVNIINARGEEIPISISTAVLRDDDGHVLGAVETFRDLSAIENLRKELDKKYSFEDIISKSPHITKLFSILPDIAESESTVLIQGASGTGKELFARAIHNISPRKNGNYVVINCGTLPVQLFESELFGYVKGAFTDAKRDKAGKLSMAEGGTVFFDEIGDLPISTQVKLLRLLQQREYEPVGSTTPIKINIRILAATNRDLKKLVAQGKFRDDLYFRLAVVKFNLPPLQKRREDIPYLVDHFIKRFNSRRGKNIISVSPTVMNILMRYDFPGNIRELENIIEYGFVVCRGSIIQKVHLPSEIAGADADEFIKASSSLTPITRTIDEESSIKQALTAAGGNISEAAQELGIHRTTLWRRLKRYNLDTSSFKSDKT
ncbi:MAG: Fis family transcriptional regulator [Candidatus Zixiibacteriota bacterium]|nr:MAG: Fis family transcriptional regulator [candidate division Zixibacteria bacterium]HDL02942.1 PAS domain-containing protein [candidate division Zixibacteria bacterium]